MKYLFLLFMAVSAFGQTPEAAERDSFIATMDLELIKIILPIIAIVVSIIVSIVTIWITKKNVKKQIRTAKVEEIIELIIYIRSYYKVLFKLSVDIKRHNEIKAENGKLPEYLLTVDKRTKDFFEYVGADKIFHRVARIQVLANAYLPNTKKLDGLKNRILTFSNVFQHLLSYVGDGGSYLPDEYSDGFPKPSGVETFMTKIELDLVKEMNLGYEGVPKATLKKYFDTKFQSDMMMK